MRLLRFKHFMPERTEYSETGEETLLSVSEYYGVKPRAEAHADNASEGRALSLVGYRRVHPGDFVMHYMLAWKGAHGVSDHDGIVSPAYAVFKINENVASRRFIHHRLHSNDMRNAFRARSKGIIASRLRLYPDTFLSMGLSLPNLATQKTIADFLDCETARIDRLIEKKTRMVALLSEKRKSIITRAISGNGEESRGVRKMRLRHVASLSNSNVDKLTDTDETPVRLCNYVDVYKNEKIDNSLDFMRASATPTEVERFGLRVGDVIITKDSEDATDIGVPAYVAETASDLVCGYHLTLLRSRPEVMRGDFLFWALNAKTARDQMSNAANGITRFGLTLNGMKNVTVPCPDLAVQKTIADFLDRETAKLSSASTAIEKSIELLREYRAALITAAVTGQIDTAAHATSKHN